MKPTRDEPGKLLVLEEDVGRLPAATLPVLLAVVGGVMFLVLGPRLLLFGLVPLVAVGVLFASAPGQYRLFSVDARAGALRTVRRNVLTGRDHAKTIPLADLLGARVETLLGVAWGGRRTIYRTVTSGSSRPNIRLTFRQARRPTVVELPVDALDKPAKGADFAARLGAAVGLPWQRVVRSDAQEAEIELSREGGSGFSAIPEARGASDYAHDVVAPAAAAAVAEERVAPFDPKRFESVLKVTTWRPGELVRLDKPLGAAAIGCLPFVVAGFLVGPAVFLAPSKATPPERLASVVFLGLAGIIFGLSALLPVLAALPKKVVFDWGPRTLTSGGLFRRKRVAFSDLCALEFRCVYTRHHGKRPWDGYRCDLVALVRDPLTAKAAELPIVSTRERQDDPDTPYAQSLPLAHELAKALGVERRVVPYAK